MEFKKRVDVSEQHNDQQNKDSSSEPDVKARLQTTPENSKGNGRFMHTNKSAKSLQVLNYVQERLELVSIQKGCERKRASIAKLQRKKETLKTYMEQMDDPFKEAKLKQDIASIAKDIDERIQKERKERKAACERLKKLNTLALQRVRQTKKCNVKGCNTFGRFRVHVEDIHGLSGLRCWRHGGRHKCNVKSCRKLSQGFTQADLS